MVFSANPLIYTFKGIIYTLCLSFLGNLIALSSVALKFQQGYLKKFYYTEQPRGTYCLLSSLKAYIHVKLAQAETIRWAEDVLLE